MDICDGQSLDEDGKKIGDNGDSKRTGDDNDGDPGRQNGLGTAACDSLNRWQEQSS